MIGSIIQGIGSIFGAISGAEQKKKENEQADANFQLQKDQFEYQKELNNKTMEREDNAVQRRAQDLEKAGLSKTLAAGSSAQASTLSSAPAPQRAITGSSIASAINGAISTAKDFGDIMHLNTQNQIGQKDIEIKEVEKENIQADTDVKKQDEAVKRADAILKNKDASNYEKKLAQNIKESEARILNMQVQNELNKQETANKKHNWAAAKIYGLPIGVKPDGTPIGAIGNDLARTIFSTVGISDAVLDAYGIKDRGQFTRTGEQFFGKPDLSKAKKTNVKLDEELARLKGFGG